MSPLRTGPTRLRPDPSGPRTGPGAPSAPPDASMRLLREVMDHPLDPAYELAARRRAAGGRRGRAGLTVTIALAVVCGALFTRGVVELNRPEPGAAAGRAALEREIDRRTALSDDQRRRIETLRAEIAAAQAAQLTSPEDTDLSARVAQLAVISGELPVTGPGMKIVMSDAPSVGSSGSGFDPRSETSFEDGRVVDRDIQVVVNGLWAAGAEAISVNGRRLHSMAAIRSAGQAILVDFRPLVPPYVIEAVGDASRLESDFAAGHAGSYVQNLRTNFGMGIDLASAGELRLPGAGTFELRRAVPPDPSRSASASSPRASTAVSPSVSSPAPVSSSVSVPNPSPSSEVTP